MSTLTRGLVLLLVCCSSARAEDEKERFPLGDQIRVLADDAQSSDYRRLVVEEMLITELAAEWQRVETIDNAEAFLQKHGGQDKVRADSDLQQAYEKRVAIREKFLDVMRAGFARFKVEAPFDRGVTAEMAGTFTGGAKGVAVTISVVLPSARAHGQWPRFRGPSGQGYTPARQLPVHWSETENIVWRTSLPGLGNSSPIIWDNHIFLSSAEADGSGRAVHCLRREDGQLLWSREIPSHETEKGVRAKNGYASGTPVTDGERVIAFFGTGGLVAYDYEGNLKWHHLLNDFKTMHGSGGSPLLYNDSVIMIHDQNFSDSCFLALDKRTGELLWEQKRGRAMGWSTPVVVRVDDHDELVFAGGKQVKGYDPANGKELWSIDGPTREVVPTIVVGTDLLYSSSGRNGPTIALRPGGSEDVTETHTVWRAVRGGPHVPSPAYHDRRLYTINDTGIATCLDAQTGKLIWQARIRARFSASPIVAGDLLYFSGENGVTYVLRAGDEFDMVAKNDLGSPILASPAIFGQQIFIRTQDELVCIGESATQ